MLFCIRKEWREYLKGEITKKREAQERTLLEMKKWYYTVAGMKMESKKSWVQGTEYGKPQQSKDRRQQAKKDRVVLKIMSAVADESLPAVPEYPVAVSWYFADSSPILNVEYLAYAFWLLTASRSNLNSLLLCIDVNSWSLSFPNQCSEFTSPNPNL